MARPGIRLAEGVAGLSLATDLGMGQPFEFALSSCVLALEPGGQGDLSEEQFDTACRAMANFVDIKSSYTLGHSSGVAALAAEVDCQQPM
jgi:hypothetical protein